MNDKLDRAFVSIFVLVLTIACFYFRYTGH